MDSPARETTESSPSESSDDEQIDQDELHEQVVSSIHASLSTLLLNEKFSDMEIRCGEHTFKAHRAVVCTQSPFFDKALSGDFKEAGSQTVDLPEDDPDIVQRFLEFMYTGNYKDCQPSTIEKPSEAALLDVEEVQERLESAPGIIDDLDSIEDPPEPSETEPEKSTGENAAATQAEESVRSQPPSDPEEPDEEYEEYDESSPQGDVETNQDPVDPGVLRALAEQRGDARTNLRVYIMAEKYDVPALRLLARDRFYRAVESIWDEMEEFSDIIDEIYQCTPPNETAMRELVCRLVGNRITENEIRERMRPVMAKHGDFAVGVMEYMIHLSTTEWT